MMKASSTTTTTTTTSSQTTQMQSYPDTFKTYDELFDWSSSSSSMLTMATATVTTKSNDDNEFDNNRFNQDIKTLNQLQKLHNISAILKFIDLTNNFTAEDLMYCRRVSLNQLNFTIQTNNNQNRKPSSTTTTTTTTTTNVYNRFDQQADIAIRTSHFLSNLFSFKNLRENISLHYLITNKDFYWSLLLANLQSDDKIFGAGLSFSNQFLDEILPNFKHFTPFIYRDQHSKRLNNTIRMNLFNHNHQHLHQHEQQQQQQYSSSSSSEREYFQSEWYWKFAYTNYRQEIVDQWRSLPSSSSSSSLSSMTHHYLIQQQQQQQQQSNNKNNINILYNGMGVWSSPYIDCGITKTWLISYIVPFYGIIDDSPILIGLVFVSINLKQIDMDQCSNSNSFFSDTHKCHTPSTQCQTISGLGFRSGSYICKCRQGYYYPNSSNFGISSSSSSSSSTLSSSITLLSSSMRNISGQLMSSTSVFGVDQTGNGLIHHYHQHNSNNHQLINFFSGRDIEQAFIETIIGPIDDRQQYFYPHNFICLPCEPGCRDCDDDQPCFIKFDQTFRIIVLIIQLFCIIIAILIALLTFRLRYTKRVASSRWVMLETLLLGAILLYLTVIIRYHESSTITCFLEPWFREIGFAFCYGSIVIKVYRIYAEFQTRKAHRVCVQDKDLLKYLFGIILIVFGYMSAWTALVIDGIENFRSFNLFGNSFNFTSRNILDEKYANNGLKFYVCRKLAWDYVTEIGEILFLLSGVYLTYRIRNAKKEIYKEKLTLTISILLETIVSFFTYVIKHAFWSHPSLHPDHLLLLYAIRCQITITTTIIMLFMPKFFYKKPKRNPHHRSRYLSSAEVSDMMPDSLHSAILSNGEIDIGEINLSDMDPEDIRAELRRVYTQLQVLKNKSIRKDNPHISKRRGGRKSHRRFSLQPFHHKHKHDQEVTEISKTPEESTASIDGNTSCMPDGPSVGGVCGAGCVSTRNISSGTGCQISGNSSNNSNANNNKNHDHHHHHHPHQQQQQQQHYSHHHSHRCDIVGDHGGVTNSCATAAAATASSSSTTTTTMNKSYSHRHS
nr:probable G-protein coupled receptor 158 [Dermatophagoides farinae]